MKVDLFAEEKGNNLILYRFIAKALSFSDLGKNVLKLVAKIAKVQGFITKTTAFLNPTENPIIRSFYI